MQQKNGFYLSMIRSKAFKILVILLLGCTSMICQSSITGKIIDEETKTPLQNVEVYNKSNSKSVYSNQLGEFAVKAISNQDEIVFISLGYEIKESVLNTSGIHLITLKKLKESLSEVVIRKQQDKVFGIKNLKEVEGTAIYAGKKTESILIDQVVGNKASGNARQALGQVTGLNIYETEDAGLQLNIGGRGLDPNRTANFNTRQNGYDISADVLGYPESYYTPPLEALEEIQIIRGAASLQYGTQFGGLVNFKMKQPNPTKELEWTSRIGGGSFGLVNVFNSFSGTVDKWSYYTYHQYKKGDGFRSNSNFESHNMYANIGYQATEGTKITFESTYLNYLAKQAGGISDSQFEEDPFVSNRTRNFFDVDWILLNLKLEHDFSENTKGSINIFHLNAARSAIGFRVPRPSQDDDLSRPRELLVDEFKNWGAEARILSDYKLFNANHTFLIGTKYYQSDNFSRQGVASKTATPDFTFRDEEFPEVELRRSTFNFPNVNIALFGENIFRISDRWTVTPGFRFEYIKTVSDGVFSDLDIQPITNIVEDIVVTPEFRKNERSFVLLGLGLSYKPSQAFETFANFSQNYRSVTFNDIRVVNPNLEIAEDITDETGYTFDLGVRGTVSDFFRYDANVFALLYDNRISISRPLVSEVSTKRIRDNLGQAYVFGLESLFTVNTGRLFFNNEQWHWQHFINTSIVNSEYTKSELQSTVSRVGNEVEFVPNINFKTGVELGYKNLKTSLQFTHVGEQFTDGDNSDADNIGISGPIPSYSIVDFSAEYTYKKWKLEAGVNNLLNERYFTRRATGYPGPGIIPSAPRNFYAVLQLKF